MAAKAMEKLYAAAGRGSAGAITVTGVKIGERILSVVNVEDGAAADVTSQFETRATVVNQIQQTGTTGISASDNLVFLVKKR